MSGALARVVSACAAVAKMSLGDHRCMNSLLRALWITTALCAACVAVRAQPTAEDNPMAQRLRACTTCHGKEGRASSEGYLPRIAGKPAGYLYNQLLNFRDGRRQNAAMARLLAPLSDAYLRDIAAYFAALDLPYPPPQVRDAPTALLNRGAQLVRDGDATRDLPACTRCHGSSMTGRQPSMPGLLGLPRDYLMGQLGAWRQGLRHAQAPDCMATVAKRLSPDDVVAAATWLASQAAPASSVASPATSVGPYDAALAPLLLECAP